MRYLLRYPIRCRPRHRTNAFITESEVPSATPVHRNIGLTPTVRTAFCQTTLAVRKATCVGGAGEIAAFNRQSGPFNADLSDAGALLAVQRH